MIRRFVSVAALCALLTGCMFYESYPSTWAKAEGSTGCAGLAGRYAAIGEPADPSGAYRTALATLMQRMELASADVLELNYAEGRLTVTGFLRDGRRDSETVFSKADGTLSCGGSGATVTSRTGMTEGQGNPLVGVTTSSVSIERTADGALVATRSEHAAGLVFMFLPVVLGERNYYRFAGVQ